ncbi:MAG: hypothetical protein QM658_06060 [Gordonia sp. (in: high G+C Gram-positive bacteria)]
MYAASAPGELAGIAFVAANTPDFRVYPGITKLAPMIAPTVAAGIAAMVGYYPGDTLRFLGRQPRALIQDWARLARTGSFDAIGHGADYSDEMRSVDLPVLAVSVEGDRMAPPSAVEALVGHLPNARVTRWHCGADDSDGRVVGHIGWIFHGRRIAEVVGDWLRGL